MPWLSRVMACLCCAVVTMLAAHPLADDNAAPFDLVFQKADARTIAIIKTLLPREIGVENWYSETQFGQRYPSRVLAVRTKVSASEPPYLFIEIAGGPECGNVNCPIWGYEPTKEGWRKVFDGLGYKWTVLSYNEDGHHDISERFHDDAFEYTVRTFRWTGSRYQRSASRVRQSQARVMR